MDFQEELFILNVDDGKVTYANSQALNLFQVSHFEEILQKLNEKLSVKDYNDLIKKQTGPFFLKVMTFKINEYQEEKFSTIIINLMNMNSDFKGHLVIFIKNSSEDYLSNKSRLNLMMKENNINLIKDDFVANVSHELRTPLHGILSYAQFGLKDLEDHMEHHRTYKFLENIYESGLRMLKLVDDLLDLSKLEANKLNYIIEEDNLRKVLDIAIQEFETRFESKSIQIFINDEEAPGKAYFDRSRMLQVMRNLIQNSLKFSSSNSTITFSIYKDILTKGDISFPAVRFIVEDEGIGIDPNDFDKVFEKFSQGRRTMKGAGGSGLGLSISRKIIEDHGGKIFVGPPKHGEEKGCRIIFILPIEIAF